MYVVKQLDTRNVSTEVNTKPSSCLECLGFGNWVPAAWIESPESSEDYPGVGYSN